jgi:hypothetical protein
VSSDKIEGLSNKGWKIDPPLIVAEHYPVSRLTPKFINKKGREKEVSKTSVVIVR